MDKPVLADVVELTRYMIREYINGNPQPWFDSLSQNSVFISAGENMIIGADNIKQKLYKYGIKGRGILYREDYSRFSLTDKVAIVVASFVTGTMKDKATRISSCFTLVFQLIGKETRLVFEHASDTFYTEHNYTAKKVPLPMDINTFNFVKQLLMDHSISEKLCIENSGQTLYIDPKSLIYIKANGTETELHCIDRIITCNKKLHKLKEMLNDDFYQIHRSYIINIHYLNSIRCYKAELLSGITLPIPAATYGKIKNELESRMKQAR